MKRKLRKNSKKIKNEKWENKKKYFLNKINFKKN